MDFPCLPYLEYEWFESIHMQVSHMLRVGGKWKINNLNLTPVLYLKQQGRDNIFH